MEAIDQAATLPSAQANINTVVAIEEEALQKRTPTDRISDLIASFVGSILFVVLHLGWFGIWVAINTGWLGADLAPVFRPEENTKRTKKGKRNGNEEEVER